MNSSYHVVLSFCGQLSKAGCLNTQYSTLLVDLSSHLVRDLLTLNLVEPGPGVILAALHKQDRLQKCEQHRDGNTFAR
jgi:hypothetical protein